VHTLPYDIFDPSACAFPSPRVPLLPTLTAGAVGRTHGDFEIVGGRRPRRTYTRGRYALHDAYRLSGIGPAGGLLAPAYHCRTMLDPAIRLGAPIVLYPLDDRLVPDIAALHALVERAAQPVRALLLTHYFGFAQAVEPVRAFCDTHGIALIEDCSHALFHRRDTQRLGRHGRYVTASPYKMFPCEEGGLLIANENAPLPAVRRASPRAEVRALADALQRSWTRRRNRRGVADLARLDADIRRIAGAPLERGAQSRARQAGTSAWYDPRDEGRAGSVVSQALMRLCDIQDVAARRRAHYARWCDAVRGLPHCRVLFERLPEDCVPYMFPLLIDHPDTHFYVLKQLGMPIWRWDDMAVSDCGVSQRYRQHLLHLPCHQALSDAELAWMTTAVAKVMHLAPGNDTKRSGSHE
jgi:dTDP-4-amino-4,6-dideoxygalactose transaminase